MDAYTTLDDSSYTQVLLQRLVELHRSGAAVPGDADHTITPWLLHRLLHCLLSEGYGT